MTQSLSASKYLGMEEGKGDIVLSVCKRIRTEYSMSLLRVYSTNNKAHASCYRQFTDNVFYTCSALYWIDKAKREILRDWATT
jgi:hypothetical protein